MPATMKMRLAVLALALIAATPSIARADATAFLGRNSAGDDRSFTRGFAFGVSLLVVGFEFEYANSSEDQTECDAVASHDLGQRLRSDLRPAGIPALCHDRRRACIANALGTMKKRPLC